MWRSVIIFHFSIFIEEKQVWFVYCTKLYKIATKITFIEAITI